MGKPEGNPWKHGKTHRKTLGKPMGKWENPQQSRRKTWENGGLPSGTRLHNELETHHAINGKTHYCLFLAMVDSYVRLPEGMFLLVPIYW